MVSKEEQLISEFNRLVKSRNEAKKEWDALPEKQKRGENNAIIIIPLHIRLRNIMCDDFDWGVRTYEEIWNHCISEKLIDEAENYKW